MDISLIEQREIEARLAAALIEGYFDFRFYRAS